VNAPPKPFFLQALDALKQGDRRGAATLLTRELREGNTAQKNLPSVAQLAAHVGEIELAVEASRRAIMPGSIDSLLAYWAILGTFERSEEALADIQRQPVSIREHPTVLHIRGNIVNQLARADEAEELFRRALAKSPGALQTWFALAMTKTFKPGDPDIAAMEQLERMPGTPPEPRASLCYGLGKAWEDCGDADRAFDYYSKGAALVRHQRPFDVSGYAAAAEQAVRDFTPDNLAKLIPSHFEGQRSLFVTGLPRSGTTLTEQMLVDSTVVSDGAELGLFPMAIMPLRGGNYADAVRYQESSAGNPWSEIAQDYAHLVDVRFGSRELVVDKSLGQSLLTGLILHSIPDARIAWLRRDPEDVAISCFRTYFTAGLTWTCSLTDIADYMRADDRLFEHWRAIYPDRILAVPYEELVRSPAEWSNRLGQHFGLQGETSAAEPPASRRAVSTASVAQARQPISTSRIGQAAAFERHLQPFRDRYYR
jgi:tetratricopeptide (TPR) repeat protein